MFKGSFSRVDLTSKFEMGMANATRDIALYRELAPSNSDFDNPSKTYIQNKKFKPLFEYEPRKTLAKLANKISDGFDSVLEVSFPVDAPMQLNVPDIAIVAKLVQAVINKKAVSIIYTSLSSGSKAREIIPHTIVDNGLRWHVRAFDRNTNSFRDFVITRISKVTLIDTDVEEFEKEIEDNQWMRKMDLHLVPHPTNVEFPQAIELDYGMDNGLLQITVRAALVGYLLRRWNVDCTEDSSLIGGEYQLWLRNRQTLYGAENLAIAPGYQAQ
ncbi:WYL domain-containing protein [Litorilituus sediminis]|uniref:WYL domain-containing protein n=1 Tax=Litorilituus sediminis TaxID=718192 RepID=A0A4P6P840_9GAMM|nr:WYL domain-containing protein [Litorilituus sediminis]QBG37714.1 WYL domain-containing protein [Litorilituus sediminis]